MREVYVGGYSNTIEVFHLSYDEGNRRESISLTHKESCKGEPKSSFLAVHRDSVYAIHELDDYEGKKCGAISFSKVKDSKVEKAQCQSTAGQWPCHLSLNMQRRCAYVACYLTPYFSVMEILEDGQLGNNLFARCYADTPGSGVVADRQEASHPHSAYGHKEFVYVPDLGCDRIWHYRHSEDGVVPTEPEFTSTPPGSGPRHMAFHRSHNLAFLLTELSNQIIVYRINENGSLTAMKSYSYLPEETNDGNNTGAEIEIHPSGEYLYLSNRVSNYGTGSMVCYKILGEDGDLQKVETVSLQGTWPRNFNIDPSGNVLLCADQHLNVIEVFAVNKGSGKLDKVGTVRCNNSPACIVFKDMV